uniref:Carbonic anhydrase n=1 Tax=Mola mola TaxID=94237 RepID=A0A3Q3W0U1_MOLML
TASFFWGVGDLNPQTTATHKDNRQSPIDIVTSHVETDHNLGNFTFVNFNSRSAIKSITNNRHTVKFKLAENEVEVSGGGLSATYSTIQFHFHWGDTEHHPGSEHTVDGLRYPMEMHIVSLKKGLSVSQAIEDSSGIAVLGFFLNVYTEINSSFSIDDLIGNVDLTKFYRYMGSLTTPSCNEAVVWTVFQQPINISKNLVSCTVRIYVGSMKVEGHDQ